jgi:hypothetical protein
VLKPEYVVSNGGRNGQWLDGAQIDLHLSRLCVSSSLPAEGGFSRPERGIDAKGKSDAEWMKTEVGGRMRMQGGGSGSGRSQ